MATKVKFGRGYCAVFAAAMAAGASMAGAQSFTPGNLVVVQVGEAGRSTALNNAGTAVFLQEFAPTGGAPVTTTAMPSSTTSGTNADSFVLSGSATSDGTLLRSVDGRFLTLAGYGAGAGTASVATTGGHARLVGLVGANRAVDISTRVTNAFTNNNFRSALTVDGTAFYGTGTGTGGGTRYIPFGSSGTNSVLVSSSPTNTRVAGIANGNLYVATQSGAFVGVSQVGSGLPTAAGNTTTVLPGTSGTTTGSVLNPNAYGFQFFDLDATVPGVDTLYVANDTNGGIRKFTFDTATNNWLQRGSPIAGSYFGLAATTTATGTVEIYATTATASTTPNSVIRVVDSGTYTTADFSAPSTIATAGTNNWFRGIAFAPSGGVVVPPTGPASIKWAFAGPGVGTWDTVATNWITVTGTGSARAFVGGDVVSFDTTAAGRTVEIVADVAPRAIAVTGDYTFTGAGRATATNALSFSDATVVVNASATGGIVGTGNPALSGNNSFVVNGGTLGFGGTLPLTLGQSLTVNAGGTASAGATTLNGGALAVNAGGTFNVASLAVFAQPLTVPGTITSTGDITTNSTLSVEGRVSAGGVSVSPSGSIKVAAGGLLRLTGTGTSNLAVDSAGGFDGDVELTTGGRLNFNVGTFSGAGRVLLNGSAGTSSYSFAMNGNLSPGSSSTLALDVVINANNASGPVTLNLGSVGFNAPGAPTTLTYAGSISGQGNLNLAVGGSGGAGVVILANTSTYSGNTTVNSSTSGVHRWAVNQALPATTLVTFNTSTGAASGPGALDLNGFSQTIAGLGTGAGGLTNSAGTSAFNGGRVINAAASASNLTVNVSGLLPGSSTTYSGVVLGSINLTKVGPGTQTFLGSVNTGAGLTVSEGAAVLGRAAPSPDYVVVASLGNVSVASGALLRVGDSTGGKPLVLVAGSVTASGFVDLKNNDLILTGSTTSAARAAVAGWIASAGGADPVGLGSSMADRSVTTLAVFPNIDPTTGLVFFNTYDGVSLDADDVLVKYTYVGDTNVDGKVDGQDLVNALEGFSAGLTGWENGDFDYDGAVTAADLGALTAVLGQNLPALSSGDPTGGLYGSGAIPEPAALGLLAAAIPLASRRRRTK